MRIYSVLAFVALAGLLLLSQTNITVLQCYCAKGYRLYSLRFKEFVFVYTLYYIFFCSKCICMTIIAIFNLDPGPFE